MTYPDPRYPQQQPPYPYQQPGYPPPYGYPQPQPEPRSDGNSAGWHVANMAITTLFRGTYGLGGSARNRVITALMCLGIGLVALVIVVLAGMYLR